MGQPETIPNQIHRITYPDRVSFYRFATLPDGSQALMGEHGEIVPPEEAKQLITALLDAYTSPEEAARLNAENDERNDAFYSAVFGKPKRRAAEEVADYE